MSLETVTAGYEILNQTPALNGGTGRYELTISHNLGTDAPVVDVFRNSDSKKVLPYSVTASDANTVVIDFSSQFAIDVYVV